MSINFATLQGLTIPEGVVTQITDASGRVIWAGKEVGTLTLRPSADISVEHTLTPSNSTAAYLLINEELADYSSTYIYSDAETEGGASVSKFKLAVSGQALAKSFVVTSVNIVGHTYSYFWGDGTHKNEFRLEINGTETASVTDTSARSPFDFSVSDAIALINEAVATSGALPDINIIITSYRLADPRIRRSGVTQVYVVLGYEA